ncbi:MAG: hypothetical protein ACI81T_002909, partial [Bacteroidia bacterium]
LNSQSKMGMSSLQDKLVCNTTSIMLSEKWISFSQNQLSGLA